MTRPARLVRLQRRKHRRRPSPVRSRRAFLAAGAASLAGGVAGLHYASSEDAHAGSERPIRPPTADPDDKRFRAQCIRCGLCGSVCESGCIRFFGLDEPEHGRLTPYVDVRRRSCTLCMRCTEACPTEALKPVAATREDIVANVRMGRAQVERDLCLSYLGRICGLCHDACPLPGTAIRLTPPGLPVVLDACVGCGRCVELCPQIPTAIDVVPPESNA